MYFYVDTREMLKEPKEGKQFVIWYGGSSQVNPQGYVFKDHINGEETEIRSMDEAKLSAFIRTAYHRAPYLKPKEIDE